MHVHVHGHVHGYVDGHGGGLSVVRRRSNRSESLAVLLGRVAVRRHPGRGVVAAGRAGRVHDRVFQRQQHVGHAFAVHAGRTRHAVSSRAAPTACDSFRYVVYF